MTPEKVAAADRAIEYEYEYEDEYGSL